MTTQHHPAPVAAPDGPQRLTTIAPQSALAPLGTVSCAEPVLVGQARPADATAHQDALAAQVCGTVTDLAGPAVAPVPAPARPVALTPLFENIPQELRDRPQWVCWRYEWKKGKWTKVLYTPFTTNKAASNRPGTWHTFRAARACYEDRPDFFDGIGYVFSVGDPYVGGDIDSCLDPAGQLGGLALTHLPVTYAEISPSGSGVKFIARAAKLASGRKTARGELYSSGRYFTITGRVIDQAHNTITDQQAAVDTFLAALGSASRAAGGGEANGDRAALAASIPRSEWDAAIELERTQGERLLRRARAAGGEETQLALLLRRDYEAFHARWPHVGLYRADGTLDESQVIAVAAYGLKPRGFAFPEFAAILTILYGKETAARKGLARWRQDIAALWFKAPAPRYTPQPKAQTSDGIYSVPSVPRGRAGDHATLVERVYTLLLDYRIGITALLTCSELAASLHVDRRTVNKVLSELRSAGRIQTRRAGQYAGLVISFSDGIISTAPAADLPIATLEIETAPPALEETNTRTHTPRVSSEHADDPSCPAVEPQSLADLVREALAYLDAGRARVNLARVRCYVESNAGRPVNQAALARLYRAEQERRQWARQDAREAKKAAAMPSGALRKRSQSIASQAAAMRRTGDRRAPVWTRRAGIYAAEEARRDAAAEQLDAERFRNDLGYCAAEQAELLALVEQAPPARPIARAVKVEPMTIEPGTLQSLLAGIARHKARQEAAHV